MNDEVKDALEKVASELRSMAKEEFEKMLDEREPGDIAQFVEDSSITKPVVMVIPDSKLFILEEIKDVLTKHKIYVKLIPEDDFNEMLRMMGDSE